MIALLTLWGSLVACWSAPPEPPRLVILAVLDTVRARNTSLCGYSRPTTPTLEALRDAPNASVSCKARTPSNWTLPSHASFFTGTHLDVHHAGKGHQTDEWEFGISPLDPGLPTLAEKMQERGYRTLLLSSNRLVSSLTGLGRGFDLERIREEDEDLRGDAFSEMVTTVLEELPESDKPLFVVVNILDAHDPWGAIPSGVDWVPPQEGLSVARIDRSLRRGSTLNDTVKSHLIDVYDYGVHQADLSLGKTLAAFTAAGYGPESRRLVVTSDHGEFLGEHNRVRHFGMDLYDEVTTVPVLFSSSTESVQLPEQMSAVDVFSLTLDGALPPSPSSIHAATFVRNPRKRRQKKRALPCQNVALALWSGQTKLLCRDGKAEQFDLDSDPAELSPHRPGKQPAIKRLRKLAKRTERASMARSEGTADLSQELVELGYLEP